MADKKMELIVKVNVGRTGAAVAATSVNTVGILVTDSVLTGKSEHNDYRYSGEDEVKEVFGDESEAYKMAKRFFAQDTHPSAIYVKKADSKSSADLIEAMGAAKLVDVFHWVVVLPTPSDDTTKIAMLSTLKELNSFASTDFKMVHVEFDVGSSEDEDILVDLYQGFTSNTVTYSGLTASATRRVAIYAHDMTTYDEDHIGVSVASDRCGVDPARGTWAHKELTGDSPDALTKGQLQKAIEAGYNVYTDIAKSSRLFLGTTCGPTDFIDTIVKADWIKFRVQEAVFKLLQTGNEGYGIDLDDNGIAAIGAEVTDVLTTAFKNHYVMDGYTVTLPLFADLPAADKAKRKLSGIRGRVKLMDSVHTVLDIDITAEF